MADKKNRRAFNGRIEDFAAGSIVVAALVLVIAGCSSPPPIRPALDQTVINVQRSSTSLDTGNLYILVDDLHINKKTPLKKGQFATYAVNNGVHYIHGVCGKLVSEAINFTANSRTVSFVATIKKDPGLFGKKRLVISRSVVSNDTERQTDLNIQESYRDAR
jgi:PBP1b-binding outer membrane lipoprotein LpoB